MKILSVVVLSLSFAICAFAQRDELGITVGTMLSQNRGVAPTTLNLGSGLAFQADYGHLVMEGNRFAALYGDIVVMANTERDVTGTITSATRDVASYYIVPGVKIKFAPQARVTPWFFVGGGYGLYEQSTTLLNGAANPASRYLNRGVIGYGGGLDFKAWRFVSIRAEVRDYYSGSPAYNVPGIGGGQHNQVAGGGIVLNFR